MMARFPLRRNTACIVFVFVVGFPCAYLFLGRRYLESSGSVDSSIEQSDEPRKSSTMTSTSTIMADSMVDDYEMSKFLLPDVTNRRSANAVESANLSFDQIRRGDGSSSMIRFDATGRVSADVLVFLHIQKTGGTTFERYLVRQLSVPAPCRCRPGRKRCYCRRPGDGLWLFSRFSNGWPCGLHADYTELIASGCVEKVLNHEEQKRRSKSSNKTTSIDGVTRKSTKDDENERWIDGKVDSSDELSMDSRTEPSIGGDYTRTESPSKSMNKDDPHQKRRYFLTTFLRDPIARYYSEYRHVTQRGATWAASMHVCGGRRATNDELPPCYDAQTGWVGASLQEFLDCPFNLANNRQTRMLADLTLVNCYNRSAGMSEELREATMLRSAIVNLKRMAYFGLQEDMRRSQYVFERTFGLEFKKPLLNWNETSDVGDLSTDQLERIRGANRLDLELYRFAKRLFVERFEQLKRDDSLYDVNMAT